MCIRPCSAVEQQPRRLRRKGVPALLQTLFVLPFAAPLADEPAPAVDGEGFTLEIVGSRIQAEAGKTTNSSPVTSLELVEWLVDDRSQLFSSLFFLFDVSGEFPSGANPPLVASETGGLGPGTATVLFENGSLRSEVELALSAEGAGAQIVKTLRFTRLSGSHELRLVSYTDYCLSGTELDDSAFVEAGPGQATTLTQFDAQTRATEAVVGGPQPEQFEVGDVEEDDLLGLLQDGFALALDGTEQIQGGAVNAEAAFRWDFSLDAERTVFEVTLRQTVPEPGGSTAAAAALLALAGLRSRATRARIDLARRAA